MPHSNDRTHAVRECDPCQTEGELDATTGPVPALTVQDNSLAQSEVLLSPDFIVRVIYAPCPPVLYAFGTLSLRGVALALLSAALPVAWPCPLALCWVAS